MGNKRYKRYGDYLMDLQERFPEFSIEDLKAIIKHGSTALYKIIYINGDVMFCNNLPDFKFKLLIGRVIFQSVAHKLRYLITKAGIKFKHLYQRRKMKWDGYYYFGLTQAAFERWESQMSPWFKDFDKKLRRYRNTPLSYGDVVLYRIFDECKLNVRYMHFFRVKFLSVRGFKVYEKDFKRKGVEYVCRRCLDGYENMLSEDLKVRKNGRNKTANH